MRDVVAAELVGRLTHDVRSPLAVIVGTAAALRDEAPGAIRDGLERILAEAQRLGLVLENHAVAARLAAGHAPIREWITVEELVSCALVRLDRALAGRPVELAIEPTCVAHVDPTLVELLLVNLVDETLRHAGGVRGIAVREDGDAVAIELVAAGPGPASAGGPTGGLAVSRAIAAAHGGTLELRASEDGGRGTRVDVRLPFGEPRPRFEAGIGGAT